MMARAAIRATEAVVGAGKRSIADTRPGYSESAARIVDNWRRKSTTANPAQSGCRR